MLRNPVLGKPWVLRRDCGRFLLLFLLPAQGMGPQRGLPAAGRHPRPPTAPGGGVSVGALERPCVLGTLSHPRATLSQSGLSSFLCWVVAMAFGYTSYSHSQSSHSQGGEFTLTLAVTGTDLWWEEWCLDTHGRGGREGSELTLQLCSCFQNHP